MCFRKKAKIGSLKGYYAHKTTVLCPQNYGYFSHKTTAISATKLRKNINFKFYAHKTTI